MPSMDIYLNKLILIEITVIDKNDPYIIGVADARFLLRQEAKKRLLTIADCR
jgi:hypothetical protein